MFLSFLLSFPFPQLIFLLFSVKFCFSSNFFSICRVCCLSCFVHSHLMLCPSLSSPLLPILYPFPSHHLPFSLPFSLHLFLYLGSCTILIPLLLSPPPLILLSHSDLFTFLTSIWLFSISFFPFSISSILSSTSCNRLSSTPSLSSSTLALHAPVHLPLLPHWPLQ